jgi:hypothetical protein
MQERYIIVYEDGAYFEREEVDFSRFEKAERVNAHFRFQTESRKPYSDIDLFDAWDGYIDSSFVSHKREHINTETDAYTDGEKRCVFLKIKNPEKERYAITDVDFSAPLGDLFDGGVLYQIAPKVAQMTGYVFVTKTGELLVVDGGGKAEEEELLCIIQKHGGVVKHWFITHYHNDHIGAIIPLFEKNKVKVENLYFHFPTPDILADRGDGDNPLVEKWSAVLPQDTRVVTPKKGDRYEMNGVSVTVLNDPAFDVLHDFCNNSSIVYKMDTGKTKVLFTGDLERKGEDYLEDEWFIEQIADCKVVQMSHHGQKGVSKRFYDACKSMEVCLYSTPLWLWENNNGGGKNSCTWTTLHTREWMRERSVKKSYTSIENKTLEIY